jgi:hypothetical protein
MIMGSKILWAFLFICLSLTPINSFAISYTQYDLFSYTGGWTTPLKPTDVFSGYAIVRDDPEITRHYDQGTHVYDAFHRFEITYFEMIFTGHKLTHSGNGFVQLGRLYDYQVEDSYRIGDYYLAGGYGPVDIAPPDLYHRLPDLFGLWRPQTDNPTLPDLFGMGIAFTNPTPVPEPTSFALLGLGALALLIVYSRMNCHAKNAR